jgi:thioredoxin-related protein
MEANDKNPKKIFVDVYTDWCGYCKKMDASTFKDEELINFLNENFYAIKFNAEQKEEILYNDFTYKYVKGNRRGYHQLAQTLLDGKMGYPSFVLLDENKTRILLSPGYKSADRVMLELEYALQEKYKEQSFSQFKKSNIK